MTARTMYEIPITRYPIVPTSFRGDYTPRFRESISCAILGPNPEEIR